MKISTHEIDPLNKAQNTSLENKGKYQLKCSYNHKVSWHALLLATIMDSTLCFTS